jgi:hypothetical protein
MADLKRVKIRIFNEFKKGIRADIQNNSMTPKRTKIKTMRRQRNK